MKVGIGIEFPDLTNICTRHLQCKSFHSGDMAENVSYDIQKPSSMLRLFLDYLIVCQVHEIGNVPGSAVANLPTFFYQQLHDAMSWSIFFVEMEIAACVQLWDLGIQNASSSFQVQVHESLGDFKLFSSYSNVMLLSTDNVYALIIEIHHVWQSSTLMDVQLMTNGSSLKAVLTKGSVQHKHESIVRSNLGNLAKLISVLLCNIKWCYCLF